MSGTVRLVLTACQARCSNGGVGAQGTAEATVLWEAQEGHSHELKGEGQRRRPESQRMSRTLDRWKMGRRTRSRPEGSVCRTRPPLGASGGGQQAVENNPGAWGRRGQWAGAKLVKVRTAVSSRRRSLDLTLKGRELREPCIC